jgi:hypothetical protein
MALAGGPSDASRVVGGAGRAHPLVHVLVVAIRREDAGTNIDPRLTPWWLNDVKT